MIAPQIATVFIITAVIFTSSFAAEEETTLSLEGVVVTDPSADTSIFKKVGDMTFIQPPGTNETSKRTKRNAINDPNALWPNGIIPYQIASTFSVAEKKVILESMKHWEDHTCIRFRLRTATDSHYVVFMGGPTGVCRSFVGRVHRFYQPQGITLGSRCVFHGTVIHEIGHAIGFFHEQARLDRDKYIRVIESNIRQGLESQFAKVRPNGATTLNLGYDYASIMHYSSNAFANRPGVETIVALQPNIPIGNARELSPLDIAKSNALYRCGPRDTHPPPSVVVPQEPRITIPGGLSCGSVKVVTGSSSFTSPGYPSQLFNQKCAFVLKAPEGYGLEVSLPGFQQDPTPGCTEDFVQLYEGATLSPNKLIRYRGYTEGRICNEQDRYLRFFISSNVMTIYYQTNNRNIKSDRKGLSVSYRLRDIDECRSFGRQNRCHRCVNTPGSYSCECNRGYYHSAAANTCYDVNECAFNNGGCEHTCTNFGGSYRCSCRSGFFLQANGLSCGTSRPSTNPQAPTPGTIKVTSAPQTTATARPPTASPSTLPPTTATPSTSSPTNPLVQSENCGGGLQVLTASSGSIQSKGWPDAPYPININCKWTIQCPANTWLHVTFDSIFRIAGKMPSCPKDQVKVTTCGVTHGPFCHLTAPAQPISVNCNTAEVSFDAGSGRGATRFGFKLNYACI